MGPRCPIERLPQEVLERICQHLPASSKTSSCLSLVRTAKLWYAPAIRELFISVLVENEDHAQGVLATLAADQRTDGALALTVRKVVLVVGEEADRKPPPPPRIPHANLAIPPVHHGHHLMNNVGAVGNGAAAPQIAAGLNNNAWLPPPANPGVHANANAGFGNHAHNVALAHAALTFEMGPGTGTGAGGVGMGVGVGAGAGVGGGMFTAHQHHLITNGLHHFGHWNNNPFNHLPTQIHMPGMIQHLLPPQPPAPVQPVQPIPTAVAAPVPPPTGPGSTNHTPWVIDSDDDTDDDEVTPPPPPPPAAAPAPPAHLVAPPPVLPPILPVGAATATTGDEWALELPPPIFHNPQWLTGFQATPPSQPQGVSQRNDDEDNEDEAEKKPPLTLSSALDILAQTNSIQALTIRLPTAELLDERTMSTLSNLKHLRKLDIAGKLSFKQLWELLKSLPCLEDLTVSGLSSGPEAETEGLQEDFESTSLNLHSLSMYCSELDGELLHGMLQACNLKITSLKLSRFVTSSRMRFKRILQMIGPSLRQLALQRLVFRGPLPALAEQHLLHILDDLPTYSPMLEELQVAAERIVSSVNFFNTVLPSLFLTQLELDYYSPVISEEMIMGLIANLPKGRMETLSFGSKLKHLNTHKIQRACQEIGIVVLGAEDM